jgi:hypothetical protein
MTDAGGRVIAILLLFCFLPARNPINRQLVQRLLSDFFRQHSTIQPCIQRVFEFLFLPET